MSVVPIGYYQKGGEGGRKKKGPMGGLFLLNDIVAIMRDLQSGIRPIKLASAFLLPSPLAYALLLLFHFLLLFPLLQPSFLLAWQRFSLTTIN